MTIAITAESVMKKLVGLKFKDAESILRQFGYKIRVVQYSGENMSVDNSVDEKRINVSVNEDMRIDEVYEMK